MRRVEDKNKNYYVNANSATNEQQSKSSFLIIIASVFLIVMIFCLAFSITFNFFDVKTTEEGPDAVSTEEFEAEEAGEVESPVLIEEETQDDVVPDKVKRIKSSNTNQTVTSSANAEVQPNEISASSEVTSDNANQADTEQSTSQNTNSNDVNSKMEEQ